MGPHPLLIQRKAEQIEPERAAVFAVQPQMNAELLQMLIHQALHLDIEQRVRDAVEKLPAGL